MKRLVSILILLGLLGWAPELRAGQMLQVDPTSLALPPTPQGQTAGFSQIALSNTGSQAVEIGDLSLGGIDALSFTLATNCTAQVLDPGESCEAFVSLPAVDAGDFSATVEIFSDAGNISVPVTGTVTPGVNDGCALGRGFAGNSGFEIFGSVLGAAVLFLFRLKKRA